MAEFQRMPTQEELQKILYMGQMQGKTTQEIINENLAKGGTVKPLPENFFTTASAGAKRAGEYINRAGTAADVAKLFPGYQPETKVTIPTSFSVVPKMDPYSGQVMPTGIQTQQAPIGNVLQQIKPADVLGVSGAERAYGDVGVGKAPQLMDVVDTLGLGAGGMAAGKGLLTAGAKTARYAAPVVGEALEGYAANTGLLAPLVAYHGSPAKFDKFDISKMGTGEGQQVYGRGIYFAENPKVAEGYRARLAGGNDPYTYEWQGNKYELDERKDPVRHAVALSYHQGTSTAKRIAKMGLEDAKKGEMYALENGGEEYYKKMLEAASSIKKKDIKAKQGAFYTVDIPDESIATFMDWDKPLSKQNDFVKKIISSHPDVLDYIKQQEQQRIRLNESSPIRLEKIPSASVPFDENTMTGKDVLTAINQRSGLGKDGFAEQELQKLGIEGIRYKDAGSRTTKGGTNNFVVFDPSKVKILKRE